MLPFLEFSPFEPIVVAVEQFFVHEGVYAPLLLLAVEEAGVPLPIPGDMSVAYTGYQVSLGLISYHTAFLLSLISVLVGSSCLYFLSARFGQKLVLGLGKYLHFNERQLKAVEAKFRKYGMWVIVLGRQLPWFRVPITVFAGMSEMTYLQFMGSALLSALVWVPLYLFVGIHFGNHMRDIFHAHPWYSLLVSMGILATISLIVYGVTHFKRKK